MLQAVERCPKCDKIFDYIQAKVGETWAMIRICKLCNYVIIPEYIKGGMKMQNKPMWKQVTIKRKYIQFDLCELTEKRKTQIWEVMTHDYVPLGLIKWATSWRKFTFYPEPETLYENVCLKDIANFIEGLMEERKKC